MKFGTDNLYTTTNHNLTFGHLDAAVFQDGRQLLEIGGHQVNVLDSITLLQL